MMCEGLDDQYTCDRNATLIVDCDECKSIFSCNPHVGALISRHGVFCGKTLHVDLINPLLWELMRARVGITLKS